MNNIQTEILTDIRSARRSIKVAVSWLTDVLLLRELIAAQQRGVEVKIVVSCNELNIIRFEWIRKLIDEGAIVNKEGSEDPQQGGFMHYKFYIIDDKIAKSGSYNWSVNASTNREALDGVSVSKKLDEFNQCFQDSVNFFQDIANPEHKRNELQLIEKEQKDALTPEKLAAYRLTQATIKDQAAKHKRELDEKERQRKEAEEARRRADERANNERTAREKMLLEQKTRDQQAQYKPKEEVKVAQVPPTSYGK